MLVAQEPSEPRAALDVTIHTRWGETFRRNQPIVKTLVIPFPMVVRHECGERPTLGTPESLAAIRAIEASLSNVSLVPATINGDVWPMAPNHYSENTVQPLAESIAPDGRSYRVVFWHLLGPGM